MLIQVAIRNVPPHVSNVLCTNVLQEQVSIPITVYSIYNPDSEAFMQGVMATGTRLRRDSRDRFQQAQLGVRDEHKYSLTYNRVYRQLEQELQDEPEDEGFAHRFTLQQWNGERSLSSVPRRELPRAQFGAYVQRARDLMDVSPSQLQQQREDSRIERPDITWTPTTYPDPVEPTTTTARVYGSPSEGQSGDVERNSVQESRDALASAEVNRLRQSIRESMFSESDAQRSTRIRAAEIYRDMHHPTPPSWS